MGHGSSIATNNSGWLGWSRGTYHRKGALAFNVPAEVGVVDEMCCRYGMQHARHGQVHGMGHGAISKIDWKSEMTRSVFLAQMANRVPRRKGAILAGLMSAFTGIYDQLHNIV